jgi:hypothetical protein
MLPFFRLPDGRLPHSICSGSMDGIRDEDIGESQLAANV